MADDLRQREPRVEDKAFLAFVRTHRCAACGAPPPNHAAHIRMACPALGKRSVGTAEKPDDRWAVGLCRECHQDGPQAQHIVEVGHHIVGVVQDLVDAGIR